MPLTREDKTARAISAFLGFTTVVVVAFWIYHHIDVRTCMTPDRTGLSPPGYDKPWVGGKRFYRDPWYDHRTDTSPCTILYELSYDNRTVTFGHHAGNYGQFSALRARGVWLYYIAVGVVLLLVFRLVQLAVRLGFPKPSAHDDEHDDPSP